MHYAALLQQSFKKRKNIVCKMGLRIFELMSTILAAVRMLKIIFNLTVCCHIQAVVVAWLVLTLMPWGGRQAADSGVRQSISVQV